MTGIVCDTPECSQAIGRLQAARNRILSLCDRLTQLRASAASFDLLMKAMLAISAAMLALAVASLTVPVLGWVAGVIFGAIATTFLAAAIYFAARSGIINGEITAVELEMVAAREEFDKAVLEVMANCPSECWGVLDQPLCP